MGIVFGRTGTAEPPFDLLTTISAGSDALPISVRSYSPYVIASVPMKTLDGGDNAFGVLAKYIGVFGQPANTQGQGMAMTSPVLQDQAKDEGQALAMTSPVLQDSGSSSMSFVLPFEFTAVEQAPTPTDKRVTLGLVPAKIVASVVFPGAFKKEVCHQHFVEMRKRLKEEALIGDDIGDTDYTIAQYHPPFTLPWFRRNEVWIKLKESNPLVNKLLEGK